MTRRKAIMIDKNFYIGKDKRFFNFYTVVGFESNYLYAHFEDEEKCMEYGEGLKLNYIDMSKPENAQKMANIVGMPYAWGDILNRIQSGECLPFIAD